MQHAHIDIVIVNYRCAAEVIGAVRHLDHWPSGTIWLVDNSAHEPGMEADAAALRAVCAETPQTKLLVPGVNLGFGSACNLAFARSSAEFFLLLNPDARLACKDLLVMAQALTAQPRLGAVSPKIYWNAQRSFVLPPAFPQTPWYQTAQRLATHSSVLAQWAARRGLKRVMKQMTGSEVFEVDFLAGSVLMLRRSAVQEAGGLFDPDYFMFYEDSDLSLRLRKAGHQLAIVPAACATHEYRHKAQKAPMMAASQQLYFRRQFPAFYRLSDQLRRLAWLDRPIPCHQWFRTLPRPVNSADEFSQQTDGARVLAFSPTTLMMPAIFRPSMAESRCFDDAEWSLLEPGFYTALAAGRQDNILTWFHFERSSLAL